jgi:hypothetical protein
LEHLEERQLLAIDLVSGVSDPALLGVTASGHSQSTASAVSSDGRYVVFESSATNLIEGDTSHVNDVFVRDLQSGAITRVSTDSSGGEAIVNGAYMFYEFANPVISGDGQHVAFTCVASNLVDGDTNNVRDVFVKDLTSGVTTRVSTDSSGAEGDQYSDWAAISGDGGCVMFESVATNLVDGDTNGLTDVFVKDLASGVTTRLSTNAAGGAANGASYGGAISGRYAAFYSFASNLVDGDTNGAGDVFVTDLVSGVTTRVSTDASNSEANGGSYAPSVSGDGRYVVFQSYASNLVTGDTNETSDVFVKDLVSGAIVRTSVSTAGGEGDHESYVGSVSADGGVVVFVSYASNLVDGDVNASMDVFARDLQDSTTTLVSVRDPVVGGEFAANNHSASFGISSDGRYVAFTSDASNLVAGDTNGVADVFLKDVVSGVTTRVSTASDGAESNDYAEWPSVSDDGRYVAFAAWASNLVADDTNDASDVFVKDLLSGVVTRVSAGASDTQGDGLSYGAALSGDGQYVTFVSEATNLVDDDTNGTTDVFVRNMVSGVVTRVSTDAKDAEVTGDSLKPAISSNGRYVAFTSGASNLVDGDSNGMDDIFVKDLATGAVTRVNTASSGAEANDATYETSAVSDDGRYVAFASSASNLVDGDTNGVIDVFVKDLQTGVIRRASTAADGAESDGDSVGCSISADARYVVFYGNATNLVAGTADVTNVFVKDMQSGAIARLSSAADGTPANAASFYSTISGDGQKVVFSSYASNLCSGDGNLAVDVFRAANVLFNQAPSGIALDNATVAENSATGTLVGTLSTTDPDAGDTFTYTLVDNAGGRFKVVGDQMLVDDGSLLDYETATSHVITVQTSDAGGASFVQELTITLTDVHEFDSVAVFDPATSTFSLRSENASGPADYTFGYGVPGAGWQTLVGDWHGDGSSGVGLYDASTSTFYLTGAYVSGAAEYTFGYGVPDGGWIPLVGDWDGDGAAGVGLYDPGTSTFYLTNALATGVAEYTFGYGVPNGGWEPIVGDWDGNGTSGVGLYDPNASTFYLTNALATGVAEYTFGYGVPNGGWEPMVGDWNGNGTTGVGLFDPQGSTFYLTDTLATGNAEITFSYGVPAGGWQPLVGDWDGNGAAGVGLYDAGGTTFYLSNALATGTAEYTVQIAETNSGGVPLVGCWTQTPAAAAVDALDLASLATDEVDSPLGSDLGSAEAIDAALATL